MGKGEAGKVRERNKKKWEGREESRRGRGSGDSKRARDKEARVENGRDGRND